MSYMELFRPGDRDFLGYALLSEDRVVLWRDNHAPD